MPGTAREWRVGQLADFELASRRTELERKITTLAPGSPDTAGLKAKLAGVAGEQEAREPGQSRISERGRPRAIPDAAGEGTRCRGHAR